MCTIIYNFSSESAADFIPLNSSISKKIWKNERQKHFAKAGTGGKRGRGKAKW